MYRKLLSVMLSLMMVFSVIPMSVFASDAGGDNSSVSVTNYQELEDALNNPEVEYLYIEAPYEEDEDDAEVTDFGWPEGEYTIDLNTDAYVRIDGDWVIPENVTINQYTAIEYSYYKSSITCNGTWNRMGGLARIDASCDFILNGTMVFANENDMPRLLTIGGGKGVFYNNGRIEVADYGHLLVHKMVMGDGAVIAGESSYIQLCSDFIDENYVGGEISCPSGKAAIEGCVGEEMHYHSDDPTYAVLSGDLDIGEIELDYDDNKLEIASGSYVKTTFIYTRCENAELMVKGTLELDGEYNSHFSHAGTLNIAEGGVVVLRSRNEIGYMDGGSKITGNGTVMLYADLDENEEVMEYTKATLYGYADERPAQVADTITIWRSWVDGTCTHNWTNPVVVEPTCCLNGLTTYTCSNCGVKMETDYTDATNEHSFTFEPQEGYTDRMFRTCTVLGLPYQIRIRANNATLTPGMPVETAYVTGLPDGYEATIVYTDNDKAGTATATTTIGGITIYTTFEITEASNVIGVKASGSGWIYDEDREGYFANFTTLEPVFSGESYNIQSVDSRAWYTSDYKVPANKLATDPKPGETYYFSIRMSQSGIDFTRVTAENCLVSLEGFDVEITEVDTETAGLVWITVKATMHKAAISAPANVKASIVASSGKPKITWDKVEGAVKYEVWRATTATGKGDRMSSPTTTSLTNKNAVAGTKYYYYVIAVAEDGTKSEASSKVNVRCDCAQPVITMSNVASSGKVKVSWGKIDGAAKYEVYRSTTKNGKYESVKKTTALSWTDTNTTTGKTYYYKVKAIHSNTNANSAYSAIKSRMCDLARPATVTLSNVASSGKIKISWTKVTGAAKYEVLRSATKNGEYKSVKTTTSLSWTDTNTTAGKTYYYKVRALHSKADAKSALTSYKSRMCDLKRPTVSITTSSGKPKVSWKAVTGATKYQVYRATSKNGTYKLVKTTTAKYWKDTTAKKGKTYYYKVVAVHKNSGANSDYSTIVSKKCTK